MRRWAVIPIVGALLLAVGNTGASGESSDDYWPTWRGPRADGVALKGNPPVKWSESENIKWKVALPDTGDSTPVIWKDKIFLQRAIATAEDKRVRAPADAGREIFTRMPTVPYKFNLVCLDRNTGKILWEKTARVALPHEGHHPSSSLSAYSPVTDGEHVWVSFGSRGIHCYDMDGNHIWSQDLVEMLTFRAFGEGSSPAIAGHAVVVVTDHEGDSKIWAFDKLTGELLWQKERDEETSWATPLPVKVDGRYQVITSAKNFVRSYDLETGDIVWQCSGLLSGAIPSPVLGDGVVYCMTGYQRYSLLAIELGHQGDLSESDAVLWQLDKGTPYVPSALLYDDRLYFVEAMKSVLSCYDAKTGKPYYERQRLEGLRQMYSSPVGAANRIYTTDRAGTTIVIAKSDTFEVLATNTLDDTGFDASPVVVGDELYLKGDDYLYCIAEK